MEKGTSGTFLKRLGLVRKQMGRGDFEVFRYEDHEVAVIPLTGKVDIKATGEWGTRTWLDVGGRESVFNELPMLVMLPSCRLMLNAHEPVDVLIASVSGRKETKALPRLVRPEDLEIKDIGKDQYLREVRSAQVEPDVWALRVGETVNLGSWSSWPKHTFKRISGEFEEVMLYLMEPEIGFGDAADEETWGVVRMDGKYSNGQLVDEAWTIRSGDVGLLPLGSHPVGAGPATRLYYTWIFVGDRKLYGKFAGESDYV